MKKGVFTFILLSVGILNSCKKDLITYTLGINIQSSFNQDNVQVLVDGEELINKPLQTNYVLGVCLFEGQISTTKNKGEHNIKVVINNIVTKIENFKLKNNLYIGINFDQPTNEISLIYSPRPFAYD